MVTWDDLRAVLAVARHGSLAKAAKALGLNKSTVGRRLAALEDALGVALVRRTSSGYELTDAGRAATRTAEAIERLVDELTDSIGGEDREVSGTVRLTAPVWLAQDLIIPALPALRETYPGLEVHFLTTDSVLNIANREADIALRNVKPEQQSLRVRKAGEIGFAMYASRAYLEEHGTPTDRDSLAKHKFIAYQDRIARQDGFAWLNELNLSVVFRANDAAVMQNAVVANLGIGIFSCFSAVANSELVCLDAVGGAQPVTVWLVTHPDSKDISRIGVVTDWILELFRDHAARLSGTAEPG